MGFFNPFSRMIRSGVVAYFLAIARTVSPRFTVCSFNRPVLLGYRSIEGSGTLSAAEATAAVGKRTA